LKKILTLFLLAGCALSTVAPLDFPPEVEAALPVDIDRSEVNRDPDGCYFYTFAAELLVVRDANGTPICLP